MLTSVIKSTAGRILRIFTTLTASQLTNVNDRNARRTRLNNEEKPSQSTRNANILKLTLTTVETASTDFTWT